MFHNAIEHSIANSIILSIQFICICTAYHDIAFLDLNLFSQKHLTKQISNIVSASVYLIFCESRVML